ncbi:MAG: glycine cleavage system aminomethyltransferase GcvT, partial [Myxococcota bacterium]
MSELKKTPFYDQQAALGARFVPFAGFDMAVQVSGVVNEHHAVRKAAGLFDVSHMGEVVIEGPEAMRAVQRLITNDANAIENGRALYTAMCREDGGIVDDLIVYRETENRFFLVPNASRLADDLVHMEQVIAGLDCRLDNQSDDWGLLALQGPQAIDALSKVTSLDLAGLKRFRFTDGQVGGVDGVRVARTGYTGEDGFELFAPVNRIGEWFDRILEAGAVP